MSFFSSDMFCRFLTSHSVPFPLLHSGPPSQWSMYLCCPLLSVVHVPVSPPALPLSGPCALLVAPVLSGPCALLVAPVLSGPCALLVAPALSGPCALLVAPALSGPCALLVAPALSGPCALVAPALSGQYALVAPALSGPCALVAPALSGPCALLVAPCPQWSMCPCCPLPSVVHVPLLPPALLLGGP